MKFVADTGALISLACSRYFEQLVKEHSFVIPSSVVDELKQFSRYDDLLGKKARVVLATKIIVKNPKVIIDINVENAERDVFSIGCEEKLIVLTDDVRAARIASERFGTKAKPSFFLLLLLYKQKKIKKNDLINDFNNILIQRNWLDGALKEYALRLVEKL